MTTKLIKHAEICADCGSLDPPWALVNRGLLVCDECCSIHRSLGRHISQVKSLKRSHWAISQLKMVHSLNNGGVNSLWEHSLDTKSRRKPTPRDPLHPNKADFIRAKHKDLQFVLKSSVSEDELNLQLHSAVRTSNLETSLRLLAQGADPNFLHPEKGECNKKPDMAGYCLGQFVLPITMISRELSCCGLLNFKFDHLPT